MAKVINTWRRPGQAKRLHEQYLQAYGRIRADQVAGRLPPGLLRGRWGSKDAVEKVLQCASREQLPACFLPLVERDDGSPEEPVYEFWR